MIGYAFNHVSITCEDFDRSLAFYTELLELPILDQGELTESPAHEEIIGLGPVHLRFAEIDLGGAFLELFEYVEPHGVPVGSRTCDSGNVHFALTVEEGIEDVHRALTEAGHVTRSGPVELRRGDWAGTKAFYAVDPDGVTVEFIQFPPGFRPHQEAGR
jgi:catechol 2,3-dioxygenase-like lactoylglutathione lyase family enzyme